MCPPTPFVENPPFVDIYPPPGGVDPPGVDIVINNPSPYDMDTLMETFGPAHCAATLGAAGANMDGFYFDVCKRLETDTLGKTFQLWFGNVPRNSSVPLTDVKQQLGFAGGVLDDGYVAGAVAGNVRSGRVRPPWRDVMWGPIGKKGQLPRDWFRKVTIPPKKLLPPGEELSRPPEPPFEPPPDMPERLPGGEPYLPKPIGKLQDLQDKYDRGEKCHKLPDWWDIPKQPYKCFFGSVDHDAGADALPGVGASVNA